jgi:hypothetical protein
VGTIEELPERNSSDSRTDNADVRIRCVDHATPSIRKGWHSSPTRDCRSVGIVRSQTKTSFINFFVRIISVRNEEGLRILIHREYMIENSVFVPYLRSVSTSVISFYFFRRPAFKRTNLFRLLVKGSALPTLFFPSVFDISSFWLTRQSRSPTTLADEGDCSCYRNVMYYRTRDKAQKNSAILSVTHHRQNPLESIFLPY